MKVLFLRSGTKGTDPISTRQGKSLAKVGVDIYYYDITGNGLRGYLKNIIPLRKYIREAGINLVHAHYSLSGYIASLSCRGRKTVTSLMGSDILGSNPLTLLLARFFARFVWDRTIVKTAEMQRRLGVKNVRVIPNGVDMEWFFPHDMERSRRELDWSSDAKCILFCSDPDRREKNYILAEQAIAKVQERWSGHSIRIYFLKGIDPGEVVRYYCAADLLLVTSIHEGSTNTIKEAMACNCPVVSTDVGDAREIISGTEGCFITTSDPDDVASAIVRVLSSGRRTDGRNRVAHLGSDQIALRIKELYRELC
ncbi:MAG: glycosyltransferase family 4 protein [Bacteroidales bacterium]